MKLKYLRHPIRTASAARDLFAARLEMRRMVTRSERRFGNDPRYDLSAVTDGFASRVDNTGDDAVLLERICAAYIKSVEQQKLASGTYDATPWWEEVRQRSLRPVMDALLTRNIADLRAMYQNFFRNPCSTGLIGVPYGMTGAYFGPTIKDIHRRYYLSDVLHRIEYWNAQASGRFAVSELAAPEIGNPFGAVIEGTLVETGTPYRHYCAHRISNLLESEASAVAELGGGFGGMAYYLLRDRPATRYLDFDVPESIALTSYYLMTAFPSLTFLLYGEEEITNRTLTRADVVLLPLFELARMPPASVAVTFSSHSMSDVPPDGLREYLNNIGRMTEEYFLYIGVDRGEESISRMVSEHHQSFRLEEKRWSGWHWHKASHAMEVECLYCLEGVAAI